MQRQRGERRHAVGHVVGRFILPRGAGDGVGLAARRQEIEADIAQGAAAGARRIGRVGAGHGQALICLGERGAEPLADARAQGIAGAVDGIGIDVAADLARDVAFAGRHERERDESRLQPAVAENGGERVDQLVVARGHVAEAQRGDVVDQQSRRDRLQRLPAVERIAIMGGEKGEIVGSQDR